MRYSDGVCASSKKYLPTNPCPLPASTKHRKMLAMFSVDFQNYISTVVWKKGSAEAFTALPKNSKTLTTCRVVSRVSASCEIAQTGWAYINSFLVFGFFYYLPQNILSFTKNATQGHYGAFVGVTEKSIMHIVCCGVALGDCNRGKKRIEKMI